MLPNNPVSKVLSILYRNYYKNLLPYKRTTEPMAQSGPLSQQKKRSHHIFNEPTNVSSPLQQLSLLLLVHPFSVLEIQDTMTQVALGTDSFDPIPARQLVVMVDNNSKYRILYFCSAITTECFPAVNTSLYLSLLRRMAVTELWHTSLST